MSLRMLGDIIQCHVPFSLHGAISPRIGRQAARVHTFIPHTLKTMLQNLLAKLPWSAFQENRNKTPSVADV